MDINKGVAILTALSVAYPGGIEKFGEEGGLIDMISVDPHLFIVHPNLPKGFKEYIQKLCDHEKIKVVFSNRINLQGMEEDERQDTVGKLIFFMLSIGLGMASLSINPSVIGIILPDVPLDTEPVQKLMEYLKEQPDFLRVAVTNGRKVLLHIIDTEEAVFDKKESKIVIRDVSVIRDKVINDDDITNLKIALETATTLEDLLERM